MRYFKLILAILFCSCLVQAGVSQGKSWYDIEPAIGADTNSCYFDPTIAGGTDYVSSAGSPHVTFNGSTVTATAAGAGNTIIISGYTVATTDVGNSVRITGGTNFGVGEYTIGSVNTGTNSWTACASCGNFTSGAASGMTGAMGGTCASPKQFYTTDALTGTTAYMKGTYTATATQSISYSGYTTTSATISLIGYTSTHGDGGQATWTTATNSIALITFHASQGFRFQNIIFSTTAGTPGIGWTGGATTGNSSASCDNCVFNGLNPAIDGNYSGCCYAFVPLVLTNTVVENSVANGIENTGPTYCVGCYFYNNGTAGFFMAQGTTTLGPYSFINSIFYKNGTYGIYDNTGQSYLGPNGTRLLNVKNCDFVSNTDDGINIDTTGNPIAFTAINNIFYGNGGYGINLNNAGAAQFSVFPVSYNNFYYSNTSGPYNGWTAGPGDVTGTANPFVTVGSNWALNTTSGGGAAARNAGWPGSLQAGGTGYDDIGALRHQDAGGGATQHAYPIIQ